MRLADRRGTVVEDERHRGDAGGDPHPSGRTPEPVEVPHPGYWTELLILSVVTVVITVLRSMRGDLPALEEATPLSVAVVAAWLGVAVVFLPLLAAPFGHPHWMVRIPFRVRKRLALAGALIVVLGWFATLWVPPSMHVGYLLAVAGIAGWAAGAVRRAARTPTVVPVAQQQALSGQVWSRWVRGRLAPLEPPVDPRLLVGMLLTLAVVWAGGWLAVAVAAGAVRQGIALATAVLMSVGFPPLVLARQGGPRWISAIPRRTRRWVLTLGLCGAALGSAGALYPRLPLVVAAVVGSLGAVGWLLAAGWSAARADDRGPLGGY